MRQKRRATLTRTHAIHPWGQPLRNALLLLLVGRFGPALQGRGLLHSDKSTRRGGRCYLIQGKGETL